MVASVLLLKARVFNFLQGLILQILSLLYPLVVIPEARRIVGEVEIVEAFNEVLAEHALALSLFHAVAHVAREEGDKFSRCFRDQLACLLRDLHIGGNSGVHYAVQVRDRQMQFRQRVRSLFLYF